MANVAAGRLDGFWGSGLESWDFAAGGLLVQEAGGLVSNYLGEPNFINGNHIVCASTKCFKQTLQAIKPYVIVNKEN